MMAASSTGGGVQVGVVEHDLRRLAAQFQRDGHVVVGGGVRHHLAGLRRAGEGDVIDARMGRQRRAGLVAVAGDDVQRAGRQAGLGRDLGQLEQDRQASSAGLTTQALPAASAAPTLRPKICSG